MFTDWNFWLSVITSLIALGALWLSYRQVKLSNKQHLFDKRVENYLISIGLIELYKEHEPLFNKKNDETFVNSLDYIFNLMTNNSYLEEIVNVIDNPLSQPQHKLFLKKIEEIKNVASKIKFLFSNKESKLLSDFVLCYQKFLFSMYQYQIIFNKMKIFSEKYNTTYEDSQIGVGEPEQRKDLFKSLENLNKAYNLIYKNNVLEEIEKQIKLK